jgi:hypothetical protein
VCELILQAVIYLPSMAEEMCLEQAGERGRVGVQMNAVWLLWGIRLRG